MRPTATAVTHSVVCVSVSVCVFVTPMYYAKTTETIEMPFGDCVGRRNHVLDGVKIAAAAARGDKSAMRPFAKLLCTLVFHAHRGLLCWDPGWRGWAAGWACDQEVAESTSGRGAAE